MLHKAHLGVYTNPCDNVSLPFLREIARAERERNCRKCIGWRYRAARGQAMLWPGS